MTTERLLSLLETSLISLANEFDEAASREQNYAMAAINSHEWKVAEYHQTRSRVYIDAAKSVHRQVIEINREVESVNR